LNYKGKTSFKTTPGAILSLMTYSFILYFLLSSFAELSNNKNTMYTLVYENNLVENPRNLTFEKGDLEIAARFDWRDPKNLFPNKDTDRYWRVAFVTRQYAWVDGVYVWKSFIEPGIPCGYDGVSMSRENVEAT